MRRGELGFTLIEIMVVIAIIGTLAAAVSIGIPMVQERSKRLQCQRNLGDIGKIWLVQRSEKFGRPKYDGMALLYSYRKNGPLRPGDEATLLCPGDQNALFPQGKSDEQKYDDIDLNNPPEDMCSYAVRDFSKFALKSSGGKQILACDRQGPDGRTSHHDGGLVVLFDDGSARFMDRGTLEISGGAEAPIVVGPDSDHEMLKQVVSVKAGSKD